MNINNNELAKKLGISRQAVSKWFNGKSKPRSDKLVKIAKALNITVDNLLEVLK